MTEYKIGDRFKVNTDFYLTLVKASNKGEIFSDGQLYRDQQKTSLFRKKDILTIERIGERLDNNEKVFFLKRNADSDLSIIASKFLKEGVYLTSIYEVTAVFQSVEIKMSGDYCSSTPCSICGAPGYQPFMGPFECSKGCKT